MLTIGDFARHGRVSIRMLRHYDAIGLLRPAHVDQASGYRFYQAAQLSRLNRIVALKDLGFTLQQVQAILDEDVRTQELRGMLRLRRAELERPSRRQRQAWSRSRRGSGRSRTRGPCRRKTSSSGSCPPSAWPS
jgi:DNA-binding transcriptional MerR regulator